MRMYRREGKHHPPPHPPTRSATPYLSVPGTNLLSLSHILRSLSLVVVLPPAARRATLQPQPNLHPQSTLLTDSRQQYFHCWLSLLNGPLLLCNICWRAGFPLINIQEGGRTVLPVCITYVSPSPLPEYITACLKLFWKNSWAYTKLDLDGVIKPWKAI